jgi:formylmethanofuran dehydrogenase subunit D
MALACGGDLGFGSLDELHEEMGRLVGAREGSAGEEPVGAPDAAAGPGGSVEGLAPQPDWERVRGDVGATAGVEPGDDARADDDGGPGDALLLFTYPLLVDDGRLSDGADELAAALGDDPFLEVHPLDAGALGVADGARVVVQTGAGSAELPARVTDHVARGAAFVPFNQPGFAANVLLSGQMVARATISPASAADDLEAPATAAAGGDG